ncbi:MAG: ABC transporter permease [Acidobacteria bacterium]|nr:ABC transporter permease [Acidobacteriota bacterium]
MGPFLLFRLAFNFFSKLVRHRGLIKSMVARDLRSRYVGSAMGLFWSVIHPLVLLASYTFVFSVILEQRLGDESGTASFAIHLFCGILPWLVFQETLSRSSTVLIENSNLITKTLFPSEILPVSILIANLVNHLIGLGIFLVVAVAYLQKLSWLLLLVPVYLLGLSLFALGLSWFVSSVQVFLRDTAQVLTVVLTFWFWLTPIFFDEQRLPQGLRLLMQLNPLAAVVTAYRKCLLRFETPSLEALLFLYLLAFSAFLAGGLFFRYTKRSFADVL